MHLATTELAGPKTAEVANSWKPGRGFDGFEFDGDRADHRLSLQVGELGVESVRFGTMASSGHSYRSHNSFEDWFGLVLPVAGEALAETRAGRLSAKAGDWMVLAPGRREVKNRPANGREFRSIRLLVSSAAFRSFLQDSFENVGSFRDLSVSGRLPESGALLATVEGLIASDGKVVPRHVRNVWERRVLEQLAELLFSSDAQQMDRESPPVSLAMVRRAEEYIRAHSSEDLAISAVASHLQITARALQMGFRSHRGQSPYTYVEVVRLEKAHQLLTAAEEGETVTQIALDCGFNHLGRFSKQYQRRYGENPSQSLRKSKLNPNVFDELNSSRLRFLDIARPQI
jgi:AraC-like DNA-binding protein